jgi:hypothetical protein
MKLLFLGLAALLLVNTAKAAEEKSSGSSEVKKTLGGLLDGFFKRSSTNNQTPAANSSPANSAALASLSSDQIASGLKEALSAGLKRAVDSLGQTNAFLTNDLVRIPLPKQLSVLTNSLIKLNQGPLIDQFEAAMNHAAEQAIPVASTVFFDALKNMSVSDATALLESKSKTAATEFFQEKCSKDLTEKLMPIIQKATEQVGVTSAYKKLMDKASFGAKFLANSSLNLDRYVTGKALDGLFVVVGEEEKRIRENPQARVTDLLQKVFGVLGAPAGQTPPASPGSQP